MVTIRCTFNLPDFPNHLFDMETNIFTGKSKLTQNGILVNQLTEKGRPFLLKTNEGVIVKAFPKNTLPDFALSLGINGTKHRISKKLKWYEYVLGGFPILLLFIGGAIGGGLGAMSTIMNYSIFRDEETSTTSKYLKVVGIVILSYLVYFLLYTLLLNTFIK